MAEETDEETDVDSVIQKVAALQKEKALLDTIRDAYNDIANKQGEETSERQKKLDKLQEEYDVQKQLFDESAKQVKLLTEKVDLGKELTEKEQERLEAAQKIAEGAAKELGTKKALLNIGKKQNDAMEDLQDGFSSLLLRVTGVGDAWKRGIIGQFIKARKEGLSLGDIFKKLGETFKKQFTIGNIVGSLTASMAQTTAQAIFSIDQAQADFVKTVGVSMTSEDKKVVAEISEEQHKFGMTIEENTANLGKLRSQISGFRDLTMEAQAEVLKATNQFEALGIATENSAQFIDFATKAMGKSTTGAIDMQKQLFGLSQIVSASGDQLMQQMQQMGGDLAQFGDNMGQEFTNLALLADKTGVSMDKLVGIAKKFDTFRGAASAVGRLNTLLGRNLIDMKKIVGLDFADKIKYLSEQLNKSGQSFETMGRHRKQAFAAALETDVATMMQVVTGAADAQEKKFEELGVTNEEMAEAAKSATPIMRMLKASLQKLLVAAQPIIEMFRSIVEAFASMSPETKKMIGYVIGVIAALKGLTMLGGLLAPLFTMMKAGFAALSLTAPAAGAGIAGAITAISKAATAAGAGVLVFLKFAFAAALLAGAVFLLGKAFAELITLDLGDFISVMGELVVGMLGFMVAGAAALVGLLLFSIGLVALGVALLTVKTEDLRAMADLFMAVAKMPNPPWQSWTEGLDSFSDAVENNIGKILPGLTSLMLAMGLIDILGKGEGMEATVKLVTAMGEIDESSVEGLEATTTLVKELRLAAEADTAEAMEKLLKAVDTAFKKKQEMAPIIVKIGEYELFKLMDKKASKSINPGMSGYFQSLK